MMKIKAKTVICKEVCSFLSQFFHKRRYFSSQPEERSTIQRSSRILKQCGSFRSTTSTSAPQRSFTLPANLFPLYPPSTRYFFMVERGSRFSDIISTAPSRSVMLARVIWSACGSPSVSTTISNCLL